MYAVYLYSDLIFTTYTRKEAKYFCIKANQLSTPKPVPTLGKKGKRKEIILPYEFAEVNSEKEITEMVDVEFIMKKYNNKIIKGS